MIQRFIEGQLQRLAAQFPVITITGPDSPAKLLWLNIISKVMIM